MKQSEISSPAGSKRQPKRVGRGDGSGHGTTSGRGNKGQKSRAGGGVSPRFEGGQNPLVKRLPYKRGFTNIFRIEYATFNLDRLSAFDEGSEVTPEKLVGARIVKSLRQPIKVLGGGKITRSLVVKADRFSQTARKKIEAAGGKVEEV